MMIIDAELRKRNSYYIYKIRRKSYPAMMPHTNPYLAENLHYI